MKDNVFNLSTDQLKEIALSLKGKIEIGLKVNKTEIAAVPTYIHPTLAVEDTKVLVLDFGGTNLRAAVVSFHKRVAIVCDNKIVEKKLPEEIKKKGYPREQLFENILKLVKELDLDGVTSIGYCFSYPADNAVDGDATLIGWTKEIKIEDMVGVLVGAPLKAYLEKELKKEFKAIKVINDTVASLFAGITAEGSYDAYIGLIVGTGTNMAVSMQPNQISKKNPEYTSDKWITINLESGNFTPPFLTPFDQKVDDNSDNKGKQRFEKAISGMYLGKILEAAYPDKKFEKGFDARSLNNMINFPDIYKEEYVKVAHWIYKRSAQLVAASIAGLVLSLLEQNPSFKKICLMAEGTLFWSEIKDDRNYNELVSVELNNLLAEFNHKDIEVNMVKVANANLIGAAIAGAAKE